MTGRAALAISISILFLATGIAALWPRPVAYGRVYTAAALAEKVQANPSAWKGRAVTVRGRVITLFSQNQAPAGSCPLQHAGGIHALAATDGSPLLLLSIAEPSSALGTLLDRIPLMRHTVAISPTWPQLADGRWHELHGRLAWSRACTAVALSTPYLEIESRE